MNRKLLALIVGLILTVSFAHAQVAAISATPTSGCAPLTVIFADVSSGSTSDSWTFGDVINNTSTASNPNHTYLLPGIYTVTLTINGGASTTTQLITVFATPKSNFGVDDSLGCFPLNANFSDSSTSSNSTIVGWRWDFGDGDTSNLKNPPHVYDLANAAGFPVTLQVIDKNGCSNTRVKSGYIKIPDGVSPSFKTIASAGCKIPITVNLNNTTTGPAGSTLTYSWSFGDGSPGSNVISPSHTFNASGSYPIKLVVISSKGCSDSTTVPTQILAGNVTSNFQAPDSVCVNTLVNFLNSSAPAPTISSWDFGDGSPISPSVSTSHTYTSPNVYTVKLTNTFGACIDSISKQITVLSPAVAGFTGSPLISCDSLFTVNFSDQSTGASSWSWNFGDGGTSSLQSPTHTYQGYGSYTVSLLVSNASGCSGSISKTQFVQNGKPYISLNKLNSSGCTPFLFSPIITDSAIDGIKSYSWDFGDGTTSTSANPPIHSYPNAGTYYVKVAITTNGGCTASIIDTVKVGTIKPIPSFTAVPTTVCTNSPVTFTDHTTNNPDSWLWDFGDGNSSTSENPIYSYRAPGTFIVTLRAYNNGCNDSAKTTIIVNPPLAKFDYTFSCSNNNTVFVFNDSSKGADTYLWDFGDGTTSTQKGSTTHIYAVADSSYIATLTVTNNASHCTNSYSKSVFIAKDSGAYVTSVSNICINNSVVISVYKINFSQIRSYTVDYGDGTVVTTGSSANIHTYTTTGIFQVRVVLTLITGCLDSLPLDPTIAIHVSGPKADFSTLVAVGCTGLPATFIDKTTTDGVNAIKQWIWDFGDSTPVQTFTAPPFTHNFTKQGIYTVSLKVIDASGCYDSVAKINLVTVAFPSALFSTVDSMSCPGSPIQFVNNSKGYGLTYTWDFGDGSPTSNTVNPTHIYAIGTYKASLSVIDQYGCPASATNYNILVDTPHASFSLDNTFANCPPLTVNFTFTGSYYQSLKWVFGDGGISNLVNPTHFYTIPGTYSANLVITSHGGCTSTAPSQIITILGPYGALSYSPLEACHMLPVNFTLTSGDNIVKYIWLFDNAHSVTTSVPFVSFTYDSVGIYDNPFPTVILQNSEGCSVPVVGTDTIKVDGSRPKFVSDKNVLCNSGSVQFTDSSFTVGTVTGYLWDFGDGGTSTSQNPSHFYAAPGQYSVKLTVTVQGNCQDFVIVNNAIKVVASPSIDLTGDAEKCVPASMTFQGVILVADTSAFKWHWDFGNGNTDSVQNPAAQLYPVPGIDTVKLTATNSSNCSTTVLKVIKIDSIATTNAGPDTAICLGQSASLHASSSTSPAIFTWLPPNTGTLSCTACSNPIATPTTTTTYYVQSTNALGCGTIDSVVVTVVQPATMSLIPLADSICLGQKVQLIASGEQVYSWSPANGLSSASIANPFASPDTTTIYQVTGSDSLFCFKNTASVKVSVFKYPTINLGSSPVTIPIGTSYQINGLGSSDIDSINWSPTIGLTCGDCLSPIATPLTNTTYTIRVENSGGCVTLDSIRIIVTCDGKNLFVPNTFSPNGDGMNDWFYVQGKGLSTIQSMRVFNRWGQLVFEKRNFSPNVEQDGWDGNFNGKKAPSDVYIYTIEVICENSQVVAYNGNVALIR